MKQLIKRRKYSFLMALMFWLLLPIPPSKCLPNLKGCQFWESCEECVKNGCTWGEEWEGSRKACFDQGFPPPWPLETFVGPEMDCFPVSTTLQSTDSINLESNIFIWFGTITFIMGIIFLWFIFYKRSRGRRLGRGVTTPNRVPRRANRHIRRPLTPPPPPPVPNPPPPSPANSTFSSSSSEYSELPSISFSSAASTSFPRSILPSSSTTSTRPNRIKKRPSWWDDYNI